jgi:class 3 adenylate cyclase
MFTDFKGFTTFASENDPEDVVAMLDYYFRGFDEIISHFRIEKIKTIGDAYLCVSGAPMANPDHAKDMVQAALIFQEFVRKSAHKRFGKGSELLEMRIGIHSGPLVAGVVGSKKFAYDVWGDTVNVAARMEQASESGQINVSENVVQACGDNFHFYYRGELEAKNKGKLKMYFVEK